MPEPIVEIKKEVVMSSLVATEVVTEVDTIAEKDKEIAKLRDERDNYKTVALKRLGKLPGDAEFMKGADESTGLTLEETVKQTLLDKEISKVEREKDDSIKKLQRELSETKLALKNRPESGGAGNGGDGGAASVKDNMFSAEQITQLTKTALRLKADPVKYIERARANFTKK